MKTAFLALALLLAGLPAWAQTTQPVEDFQPAPSNQAGKQYPQVNSEGRARFRIVAPQAQSVRVSLHRGLALTKDEDGAWGGIQPPWIYGLMALHVEGYPLTHAVMHRGLDAWNHHWSYEREGAVYLQASESPVWDTVLMLLALTDCGADYRNNEATRRAVRPMQMESPLRSDPWYSRR